MTHPKPAALTCISPIDGRVFAQRSVFSFDTAMAVVTNARKAQPSWATRPISERIALVRAGVARLGEMNDAVVPELAWMMGRPIRYGGEFRGVDERAGHMASIAEEALAPIVVEQSGAFERRILRRPPRCRACHGTLELSLPHSHQYGGTGADRRQRCDHQARHPRHSWWASAWCAPLPRQECRKMYLPIFFSITTPPER